VRPWVITNEGDIWFTKQKDADTLYAVVKAPWKRGEWKDVVLHSVKSTGQTQVTLLGQNDQVLEYQPGVAPKTTGMQQADGLHIRAMRTQRLQDNSKWPNPAVLKITGVAPALLPPRVFTTSARWSGGTAILEGELRSMGDTTLLDVGFEYRSLAGQDSNERTEPWTATPLVRRASVGTFSAQVNLPQAGERYEYRAVVKHPLLMLYGAEKKLAPR
jgi:alpha-L-fucosidase